MGNALYQTNLSSLQLLGRGKVRDLYAADADHLLIVASDRLSAFDVILPKPIPGKGKILTQISQFWFDRLHHIVANHCSEHELSEYLSADEIAQLDGRGVLVRKLQPLPIEAVVRGYLIGSGWQEYCQNGSVCGIKLPAGLQQAQKLPETIFTPATKAAIGDHDENIAFAKVVEMIGAELATQVRDISLRLYTEAADYALKRGIIIADTKFEFGLDQQNKLVLIDEALTPDSSRFWPEDEYRIGISPPSFDKQYVRDYLETLDWDKKAPGPELPDEVILKTQNKYQEALNRLLSD